MRNNLVVHPRPVTPDERHWAEAFQSLIRTLIGFYTASRQDARAMRLALRPYHNLPFAKRAIEAAQRYGQESLAILRARRTSRQRAPELPRSMALLRSALINGDVAAAASATATVRELADAHILGLASKTTPKPRNPYAKSWHWLMAGNETGVLDKFEKVEMERIASLDLDTHRFTFLPLPERKLHDYEFIAHWMLSLTTDQTPVEISGSDYRVWAELIRVCLSRVRSRQGCCCTLHARGRGSYPTCRRGSEAHRGIANPSRRA